MLKILYFASIREALMCAQEEIAPNGVNTVAELIEHLRARGGLYAEVLAADMRFRVAVNQDMASLEQSIKAGDEIAIFPPVTGG